MNLTGKKVGQIRIEAQIGNGGMGNVYRGFDEKLERRLAVKVLREEYRMKREARARFLREARILSRLRHSGICQVYDLVEQPEADYLILEYIEGMTLGELVSKEALTCTEQVGIAVTVAEILAAAHRQDIVHRDLKPDNIMVTPDRQVKVLDFGIARHVAATARIGPDSGTFAETLPAETLPAETLPAETLPAETLPAETSPAADETVFERSSSSREKAPEAGPRRTFRTRQRAIVGTVAYMSPEQASQRPVTAASDMFSFGLVLQELFTGERAYPKRPLGVLLLQVSRGETRPVRGLGPELSSLIEDLKAPEPGDRPTAGEARERLVAVLEGPRRASRRRQRFASIAVLSVVTFTSLGATLHSRFEARNRATAAQLFGQEARDIEWQMRAAHLAPPEDIRSKRSRVRKRMAELEARMTSLGRAGRGPGEYALGRAALALGDFEGARGHLEAAWEAGYRLPEVEKALGLVLVELYHDELGRAGRISDPEERNGRLRDLRERLRDPGLGFLRSGREAEDGEELRTSGSVLKLTSTEYAEALVALAEERYDDALALALAASEKVDGFYEAQALTGRILEARGERTTRSGDYEAARGDFRSARKAYLRAAEIGRGDPSVFLALCRLAEAEMWLSIYHSQGDVVSPFEGGVAACETALTIDPDNATAFRLSAALHFRMAEGGAPDPSSELDTAAVMAREALARHPEDAPTWMTLGHIHMVRANHELFRGWDPRPSIAEAREAYERAYRLAPADTRILNSLANSHSLAADYEARRGLDPRPSVRAAVEVYRRAIRLDPDQEFFHTNLAIAHEPQAVFELARGIDPRPGMEPAREAIRKALELNPNYAGTYWVSARLSVFEARWEIRRGGDPRCLLDEAAAASQRALEIFPGGVFALATLTTVWLTRAEYELGHGGEAEEYFRRAIEIAEESVGEEPLDVDAWAALAAARRGLAEAALGRGEDPGANLARADEAVRRALELDPERTDVREERVRIAELEDRSAA